MLCQAWRRLPLGPSLVPESWVCRNPRRKTALSGAALSGRSQTPTLSAHSPQAQGEGMRGAGQKSAGRALPHPGQPCGESQVYESIHIVSVHEDPGVDLPNLQPRSRVHSLGMSSEASEDLGKVGSPHTYGIHTGNTCGFSFPGRPASQGALV